MAVSSGPKITKDGLVLYLDAANFESFRGEPTTNLLPQPLSFETGYTKESWTTGEIEDNAVLAPDGTQTATRIKRVSGYFYKRNTTSPTFTINEGDTITFSCWIKKLDSSTQGGITIWCYNNSNGPRSWSTQTIYNDRWIRQTTTYTALAGETSFAFIFSGVYSVMLQGELAIWHPQVEIKSYVTPFVEGSRGTTVATGGGWVDMTNNGNHAEFIGNVNYISDDNGSLYFPTGSDYGRIYYSSNNFVNTNYTWCAWVLGKHSRAEGIVHYMPDIGYGSFGWPRLGFQEDLSSGVGVWQWMAYKSTGPPDYSLLTICNSSDSDWIFLSVTADYTNNFIKVYSNGEYKDSSAYVDTSGNGNYFGIGKGAGAFSGWNEDFQGKISNVMVFNRALTDTEIKQIYEATRARYGL